MTDRQTDRQTVDTHQTDRRTDRRHTSDRQTDSSKTSIAQQDARDFPEKLGKVVTFLSRIFEREELIAFPKLPPGLTTCSSWHY